MDTGGPLLLVLLLASFLTFSSFLLVFGICLIYCVYSGQEDSFILKASNAINIEILRTVLCPDVF